MDPIILANPKFHLGQLVITRNAQTKVAPEEFNSALQRHIQADWGEMCQEDKESNDLALESGGRLFSSYTTASDVKFWIITEADYSVTTILLPEDY